jgi:hypothetical protein
MHRTLDRRRSLSVIDPELAAIKERDAAEDKLYREQYQEKKRQEQRSAQLAEAFRRVCHVADGPDDFALNRIVDPEFRRTYAQRWMELGKQLVEKRDLLPTRPEELMNPKKDDAMAIALRVVAAAVKNDEAEIVELFELVAACSADFRYSFGDRLRHRIQSAIMTTYSAPTGSDIQADTDAAPTVADSVDTPNMAQQMDEPGPESAEQAVERTLASLCQLWRLSEDGVRGRKQDAAPLIAAWKDEQLPGVLRRCNMLRWWYENRAIIVRGDAGRAGVVFANRPAKSALSWLIEAFDRIQSLLSKENPPEKWSEAHYRQLATALNLDAEMARNIAAEANYELTKSGYDPPKPVQFNVPPGVIKGLPDGLSYVIDFPGSLVDKMERDREADRKAGRDEAIGKMLQAVGRTPSDPDAGAGVNLHAAELVSTVDQLLTLVGDRQEIPQPEMANQFYPLDQSVFVLAHQLHLHDALPRQSDLERESYSRDLPPIQFAGHTNLPGDWTGKDDTALNAFTPEADRVFMPMANGRWQQALLALRALATAATGKQLAQSVKNVTPAPAGARGDAKNGSVDLIQQAISHTTGLHFDNLADTERQLIWTVLSAASNHDDYKSNERGKRLFNAVLLLTLRFLNSRLELTPGANPGAAYLFERPDHTLPHEDELQADYYQFMFGLLSGTEFEVNNIAGGRADIRCLNASERIVVEVKREERNCSFDALEASYASQATEYENVSVRLGFLLVLDQTKVLAEGTPHISTLVRVSPVLRNGEKTPRLLVTVIVPGRRMRPSELTKAAKSKRRADERTSAPDASDDK